jgi:hypothetical protein
MQLQPSMDRAPRFATVARMSADERLRAQDWGRLQVKLTAFAWKRMGRARHRWHEAEEIAAQVIAKAFEHGEGWDPEKEPILKWLAKRVIGALSNEWSRKRNSFEVAMDDAREWQSVASDDDAEDEALDRARLAGMFRRRLEEEIARDEIEAAVVAMFTEGIVTPMEQAKASPFSLAQLRDARRRVFYAHEKIAREIAREIDDAEEDEEEEDEEVAP